MSFIPPSQGNTCDRINTAPTLQNTRCYLHHITAARRPFKIYVQFKERFARALMGEPTRRGHRKRVFAPTMKTAFPSVSPCLTRQRERAWRRAQDRLRFANVVAKKNVDGLRLGPSPQLAPRHLLRQTP